MDVVPVGDAQVHLLPVVVGLVREAERVEAAARRVRPDALAVALSPEALSALRDAPDGPAGREGVEADLYDVGLGWFGPVERPAPCYVAAVRWAEARAVPLYPLDLDEDAYTDAFLEHVTTWDLLRRGFRVRRLHRRRFPSATPEAFVQALDRYLTRPRGYRALETARERHMAGRLRALAGDHVHVLSLVECERAEGVRRALRDLSTSTGR